MRVNKGKVIFREEQRMPSDRGAAAFYSLVIVIGVSSIVYLLLTPTAEWPARVLAPVLLFLLFGPCPV